MLLVLENPPFLLLSFAFTIFFDMAISSLTHPSGLKCIVANHCRIRSSFMSLFSLVSRFLPLSISACSVSVSLQQRLSSSSMYIALNNTHFYQLNINELALLNKEENIVNYTVYQSCQVKQLDIWICRKCQTGGIELFLHSTQSSKVFISNIEKTSN